MSESNSTPSRELRRAMFGPLHNFGRQPPKPWPEGPVAIRLAPTVPWRNWDGASTEALLLFWALGGYGRTARSIERVLSGVGGWLGTSAVPTLVAGFNELFGNYVGVELWYFDVERGRWYGVWFDGATPGRYADAICFEQCDGAWVEVLPL